MTPPVAGADFLAALVASCFLGMPRSGEGQGHALPGGLAAGGLAGGLLGAGHGDAGGLGAALGWDGMGLTTTWHAAV